MPSNRLERVMSGVGAEYERRMRALERALTDPQPPFAVRLNEKDQLRKYLQDRNNGNLLKMRQSQGGPYSDDEIDRYAAHGERLLAKYQPEVVLGELTGPGGWEEALKAKQAEEEDGL